MEYSFIETVADEKRPSPERETIQNEKKELTLKCLEKLSIKRRVITYLIYYEQFKCREAAEILGIPEGTVKTNMWRGLKELRKCLDPLFKGVS